jgi:fructokinase
MTSIIVGIGEILWDVFPDNAHLGGAPANFACHAAALGDDAWIVSAVGADELGDRAVEQLRAKGVHCENVKRDTHATGRVDVTLDAAGRATYEFASDAAWDHLAHSGQLAKHASRCDAVCFGTLGQRAPASRAAIRSFVEATPPEALRVFDVNLRQQFYDRDTIVESLALASAVKLNDDELPIVARLCGIGATAQREVLLQLLERYELRLAALTCGPDGALLVTPTEESHAAAPDVSVVDTVGAGDAFTATLVHDFLRDIPLDKINVHANAVAAFVCSQPGATTTIPTELKTA